MSNACQVALQLIDIEKKTTTSFIFFSELEIVDFPRRFFTYLRVVERGNGKSSIFSWCFPSQPRMMESSPLHIPLTTSNRTVNHIYHCWTIRMVSPCAMGHGWNQDGTLFWRRCPIYVHDNSPKTKRGSSWGLTDHMEKWDIIRGLTVVY